MTSPGASETRRTAGAGSPPRHSHAPAQASTPPLVTLRKRADFLRLARAAGKAVRPGMIVQAAPRNDGSDAIGVGFTCSKKVGNAVRRNRARRRLREAARLVLPEAGRPGWDYVLIGRAAATIDRPFAALIDDLRSALARIHARDRAEPAPRDRA